MQPTRKSRNHIALIVFWRVNLTGFKIKFLLISRPNRNTLLTKKIKSKAKSIKRQQDYNRVKIFKIPPKNWKKFRKRLRLRKILLN